MSNERSNRKMHEIMVKRLIEPCQSVLTSYCPTMNLIATVTRKQNVDVWRFNGQRVFGIVREEKEERVVCGIVWKPDGRMLAVSHTDNSIILIDSFNGKVAHQLQCKSRTTPLPDWSSSSARDLDSSKPLSALTWDVHITSTKKFSTKPKGLGGLKTKNESSLLSDDLDLDADLPSELAKLNLESSLLKLSTLPASSADDDIFSSRTSIDSMFHRHIDSSEGPKTPSSMVDILLISTAEAKIHATMFDTFEIGDIGPSDALPRGLVGRRIANFASHQSSSTYYLAIRAEADGQDRQLAQTGQDETSLHLVAVDLRFISQASYHLPLLAQHATQFQNLLRYIDQIQHQLSAEVRTAFDLPNRFLRNVNEELAEKDSSASFTTTACHLILTGECNAILKDWLVDQVGERGLKRWEKAVGDCLDLIRRLTSECLLPALERSQVVISRLEGLSQYPEAATKLGIDSKPVRSLRDTLDLTSLMCEEMLKDVCTEVREFAAFIRWLKWEGEVQALEETSERAEEMRESNSFESELRTIIEYIENAMVKSRLLRYVETGLPTATSEGADAQPPILRYTDYKRRRRQSKQDADMPKLEPILGELQKQSKVVFAGIASALRKNVLNTYMGTLEVTSPRCLESRVVVEEYGDQEASLVVLMTDEQGSGTISMQIYDVGNGSRQSAERVKVVNLEIPEASEILDVKFVDDKGFVALAVVGKDRCLLWRALADASEAQWQTLHKFTGGQLGAGMIASRLRVNGSKDIRNVVVVDEADMGFAVLHLDD